MDFSLSDPLRARLRLAWSVAYACFGVLCALTGARLWAHGLAAEAPVLAWGTAGLGVAGAVVARWRLRVLRWVLCGLLVVAAFGLLMEVITLLFGAGVDSRPAFANQLLAAVGLLLFVETGRRAPGRRAPSAASREVQLAAWVGTVAFLPYTAMKLTWAVGGTFAGISGAEMLVDARRNGASGIWLSLESWGLDATVLLAVVGVFLLWGLVRPWGMVFPRWTLPLRGRPVPRWLPLTPALIGAATLAPYGLVGAAYAALASAGAVTVPMGEFHSRPDALLVIWVGMTAFAGYGLALAAATRSYWRRTR
ncbi:hypothetical protein ACFYNO_17575 [Kitasatospora sp. NPDC006697]|uniref:hypothetical protein n=1 Tax=Kitasatospora sp. NPDC006697 TaxID=3364020 RepID=UPI0036A27236